MADDPKMVQHTWPTAAMDAGTADCWQEHHCDVCGPSWEDAVAALHALPVEQRMALMGMVRPTLMGVAMPYWVEVDRG